MASRLAETADAPALARMLHDFNTEFGDPSPGPEVLTGRVAEFIAEDTKTYLVAGEGPGGFAQVSFNPSIWTENPVLLIEELYSRCRAGSPPGARSR